ncbi:peptide ABC transporter permease [Idiomarina tyrosinivorans]|uniref:Peptide ABC transporter permease n=1 Tax=Idiomarina tyrosinivorans TaxID=1445662 RepID=A0A432ZRS3_9GAMM|nr:ABC transporter permease subunit [Idiomarina tyrosinivorans]RUO80625.1 peptide ABC transporter permease [Idiomarina tyrosinivorans]
MLNTNLYYQERNPSPTQQLWRHFSANLAAMIALSFLALGLLVMLFSPWLAPYDANQQFAQALSIPPSWTEPGDMRFILGTDDIGRDLLSRIITGMRYSLGYPLVIVLVAAIVGITIGAFAGITRGLRASALNHLLDVLLSIPSLLLALVVIAILGPGLENAVIATTLVLIPQFVHSVRNSFHDEWNKDYVIASRLNGCPTWYLMLRVIMPNITPMIVMQITSALSIAILDIAALGFLGLGVQAPAPEWGTMLARSLDQVYLSPWSMILPGMALFVLVLCVNVVGDSLRTAIKERTEN